MPIAARLLGAQPPIRLRRVGKARRGRPGSQETCLRPQAHKPSWKGVGSMLISRLVLALSAMCLSLFVFTSASLAAEPTTVTVRVEGFNGVTLLPRTQVT